MASFGWSAGDILSTIALVNRVVQCIGGAHIARDHFQELLSELQGLSRALEEISELTKIPGQAPEIQALKFASCSCGETLQRFYEKIRPFEGTLGAASRQSRLKSAPRMVRWELLIKKDVPELRTYLVAHVGALNLRLNTALLKASSTSQLQGRNVTQKQEVHGNILQQLAKDQAVIVEKLGQIPTADTVPKLESLLSIAIGVWKSQNEILSNLTKASQSFPPPDLDHTWAQSPFKFEDALGRRFVIPSEYDWDTVEAIIQAKVKKGAGSVKVRSGDYELFDQRTEQSISESNFFTLIPGSYIMMSIILGRYGSGSLVPDGCTRIVCRSSRLRKINSETVACMECQGTFRKARKTLPRPMKPIISDPVVSSHQPHKTYQATWMDSLARCYKNVSIHYVELPATPIKFREKYTRDYLQPLPELELRTFSQEQNLLPTDDKSSVPLRKQSIIARLMRGNHDLKISDPQATRQRNSSGLRSTLQRHISRTPLARLNFHSSAQERYSRRSKIPLSDLGPEAVSSPVLPRPRPSQVQFFSSQPLPGPIPDAPQHSSLEGTGKQQVAPSRHISFDPNSFAGLKAHDYDREARIPIGNSEMQTDLPPLSPTLNGMSKDPSNATYIPTSQTDLYGVVGNPRFVPDTNQLPSPMNGSDPYLDIIAPPTSTIPPSGRYAGYIPPPPPRDPHFHSSYDVPSPLRIPLHKTSCPSSSRLQAESQEPGFGLLGASASNTTRITVANLLAPLQPQAASSSPTLNFPPQSSGALASSPTFWTPDVVAS